MKKLPIYLFKTVTVAVLMCSTLISCKKKIESVESSLVAVTFALKVDSLKSHVSKLLHVDTSQVKFNAESKLFIIKDKGYVTFQQAEELFKTTPVVEYANGKSL